MLIFLAEMLPIKQAIKRCFTTPAQITCASALPDKTENTKISFPLAVLVHCQNSTTRCLISSLVLTLLYGSLNLVINAFSLGLLGRMVQEKGSRERCSSWTALQAQSTSALSSGFPLLQGNAEALYRWGGKTKHRRISCFLSNTCAKNYPNRIVYVRIRASQMCDV